MNTGLLLEVLVVSLVLLQILSLFTLHYLAMSRMLLNERENRRILSALVLSDAYISNKLSIVRLQTKVNNLVDCSRLRPEGNVYLRCGDIVFGDREEKLVVRRMVVDRGKVAVFEVGVP